MADKDPRVVGGRIARRRHQLGWSQVELAERLGVSPSTVANWERGFSYPKKKLGKVEQVLGVALEDDPVPRGIMPRDDHERYILAHPDLSDDDKRLMIASHRKHPIPAPVPPAAPAEESRAARSDSAAS